MASRKNAPQIANVARNANQPRKPITLETVAHLAPGEALTANLSRTFGIDDVDHAGIREATKEQVEVSAKLLQDALSEKALQIHLQRIVGAFVGSAHGAAVFYGNKISEARQLTSAATNDDRDEDRDGPAGFESKAERARMFAAQMAMQAAALLAVAQGAVSGYEAVTGEDWKPYNPPATGTGTVARRGADAELAAFAG